MGEQSTTRVALTCAVAFVMVVGWTAAPAAAAGGDGISLSGEDGLDIDLGEIGVGAGEDGLDVNVGDNVSVGVGDDGVDAEVGDSVGAGVGDDGVEVGVGETGVDLDEDGLDVGTVGVDVAVNEEELVDLDVDEEELEERLEELLSGDLLDESQLEELLADDGALLEELLAGEELDELLDGDESGLGELLDGDGVALDENGDDEEDTFPEEICTDVLDEVGQEIPWEDIPWVDDLPEEAHPPEIPWSVLTHEAAFNIVAGLTPTVCDIQDPNDPSYNPIGNEDQSLDPDLDLDVHQLGESGDGAIALLSLDATLDQNGTGPSISAMPGAYLSPEHVDVMLDPTINDGEKDYAVEPRIKAWDNGTTFTETDVTLYGQRLGVEMDCTGEECVPGTRGLPELYEIPSLPNPAGDDGEEADADDTFPEEICTDVLDEVGQEIPWEDIPWVDDLPEEAHPPEIPWSVLTHEAAFNIVAGLTPTVCDIQDPNDPSYNPVDNDDQEFAPGFDLDVHQLGESGDGVIGLLSLDATLDEHGEGPSISMMPGAYASPEHVDVMLDPTINDGEKDYAVEPRIKAWDDGTTHTETDVTLYGQRLGVEMDCTGEECVPGTRGLPELYEIPSLPNPAG